MSIVNRKQAAGKALALSAFFGPCTLAAGVAAGATPVLSPATPGSMRSDAQASQLPAGVTRPYAAGATRV